MGDPRERDLVVAGEGDDLVIEVVPVTLDQEADVIVDEFFQPDALWRSGIPVALERSGSVLAKASGR